MINSYRIKLVALFALFLGLFASAAVAGTTDGMGAKTTWDTVSGWLDDTYAARILGLMFFAVGVWRAFAGSILQFFLMLGFGVLITQGNSIISAINTAIF